MILPVSSGQIAESIRRETGHDVGRDAVNYAILRVGVQPIGRAGRVRLFPPSVVATVKSFLDAKRHADEPQAAACTGGRQ
jgi:hypothetical protein